MLVAAILLASVLLVNTAVMGSPVPNAQEQDRACGGEHPPALSAFLSTGAVNNYFILMEI
jgi:hypothetical protein